MDDIDELYHLFPEIEKNIKVEKKVGQGTFSFVYLGSFRKNPNEKIALKYIIPTSSPSRTKQEIECLLNIGGADNVIGVLAVLRNKSHIIILMPYVDHVSFNDAFIYWDVNEAKEYIKSLIIALNRVHQSGIIHRDVKPSNFLYDGNKKIFALVDFGLAQPYDKITENIFNYEKQTTNKKLGNNNIENSQIRKNLIAISNDRKTSSHLVLTNPKGTPSKTDMNSLPHSRQASIATSSNVNSVSSSEKFQISNSQSCESNLNNINVTPAKQKSPLNNSNSNINKNIAKDSSLNQNNTNSPKLKITTPNLQKYYSFQKPSYSFSDYKCTCFNMQFVCEHCSNRNSKWAPRAGTAGFRAPEVLFRSQHQTPAVDIWSVGVIFLSILSGRYPFFKAIDDNMALMQLISLFGFEAVRKTALKYGESLICSNEKKPLDLKETCKILRKNAVQGMTSSKSKSSLEIDLDKSSTQLVEEFPDSAYDLLKKLLELDSDKRSSAETLLNHPFFNEAL